MRPILESLPYRDAWSFRCGEHHEDNFIYPFHVHPEFEFTFFLSGSGKQIIGDHIGYYKPGEMIFIGPHLPHAWYKAERAETVPNRATILNLQFREDFLGMDFFKRPEMIAIKELLRKSRFGIQIFGKSRQFIARKMKLVVSQKGFSRVLTLLEILHHLAHSKEYRILSTLGYLPITASKQEMEKIRRVHEYIMQHYCSDLNLQQAAALCGLSKSNFCHFFKKRTGRSFSRFVNELRIHQACRHLRESNLTIAAIAYENGFSNLSYFNRSFKALLRISPQTYRQQAQPPVVSRPVLG